MCEVGSEQQSLTPDPRDPVDPWGRWDLLENSKTMLLLLHPALPLHLEKWVWGGVVFLLKKYRRRQLSKEMPYF